MCVQEQRYTHCIHSSTVKHLGSSLDGLLFNQEVFFFSCKHTGTAALPVFCHVRVTENEKINQGGCHVVTSLSTETNCAPRHKDLINQSIPGVPCDV